MLNSKNRFINCSSDIVYLALLICLGCICFKMFGLMLINYEGNYRTDIPAYINILEQRPGSITRLVYVIFRALINLTGSLKGINVFLALEIIAICLANHLYIRYYSACDMQNSFMRTSVHILSIAALFTGPIYVPRIHEAFYRSTFPSFAWHSPTQQMMTLFSILATVFLLKMLDNYEESVSPFCWLASALFFFLSAYSKPSYIIDIVPAIIIAFLIELALKSRTPVLERFKRLFIIGLSLLPSGLYLLVFYISSYSKNSDSEIQVVLSNPTSSDGPSLVVALICSMLFAAVVLLFNIKKISSDRRYRLVLMIAAAGLLQWLLLSESGWRSSHGNFSWGCMMGFFILTLTSMGIAMENVSDKTFLSKSKSLKYVYYVFLTGTLALHLASNVYYFLGIYNGLGFWR